jgi:hypothetical protein
MLSRIFESLAVFSCPQFSFLLTDDCPNVENNDHNLLQKIYTKKNYQKYGVLKPMQDRPLLAQQFCPIR